jgi:hypothetical protein
MENMLKAFTRIRRIRQECFAVYGEYANRHKTRPISGEFSTKTKKIQDPKSPYMTEKAKKTISRYYPCSVCDKLQYSDREVTRHKWQNPEL